MISVCMCVSRYTASTHTHTYTTQTESVVLSVYLSHLLSGHMVVVYLPHLLIEWAGPGTMEPPLKSLQTSELKLVS